MVMTPQQTTTAYVVRDREGHVVVAFWGPAAAEEAGHWADRGYRVDEAEAPDVF